MEPLRAILTLVLIGLICPALYAQKKEITNSIGMELVLISAGSFMMGTQEYPCPNDDPFTETNERKNCLSNDENPKHKVTISNSFYMGKHEVTQMQWNKVMGSNPANFKTEKVEMNSRDHPVENVSWDDVQKFIRRLNQKEGGNKYRLPTEAEWEYAARAGTTTKWSCGNNESCLKNVAWYSGNSGNKTHPIGQKKPNAWGLYDMHGNVWEWVQDLYNDKYYSRSPSTDPKGTSSGSYRVARGGGWNYSADFLRSANRYLFSPVDRYDILGFRLLRIR